MNKSSEICQSVSASPQQPQAEPSPPHPKCSRAAPGGYREGGQGQRRRERGGAEPGLFPSNGGEGGSRAGLGWANSPAAAGEPGRGRTALSRASKPHDPAILLLIGNSVKVARGSLLQTKVQFIIQSGLYVEEERNVSDTPEVQLIPKCSL